MEINSTTWRVFAGVLVVVLHHLLSTVQRRRRAPPGPFPLPVIGNLLQLRGLPHRCFADLANIYGPLMTLQLGKSNTVIISSLDVAREAFQKNDGFISDRSIPDCLHARNHYEKSVVWLPSNQLWKDLRKMYRTVLFTTQKLDQFKGLRQQKVRELLAYIGEKGDSRGIDIAQAVSTTMLNLLSNTSFSVDMIDISSKSSQEMRDLMIRIMEIAGTPNMVDLFPILAPFDPQRLRHRMGENFGKLYDYFDQMIDKRKSEKDHETRYNDLLEEFLRSKFDIQTLRSAFTDIFVAGSDTSSITVEWAMAEIIRNPNVMTKLKEEVFATVPKDREVEESDIPRLPYLLAVVKETMRLHPAAPLLLPRQTEKEFELCGYLIPKKTRIFVNAWAIGHKAGTWEDPDCFRPERFIGREDVDYRGGSFELIPFGVGRRICPGMPLAYRMVHLMLASLFHSFDWMLPDGKTPEDVDMSEKLGLTLSPAKLLLVVPIKR